MNASLACERTASQLDFPIATLSTKMALLPILQAMKWAACTLATISGWCIPALPARAAENEVRVLILNGLDPYLPAYMAIDSAMRASLAKETTKRIVLYSAPLDAQRFAVGPRGSEVFASLAKKYSGLHIDVGVTVMKPALDFYKQHGAALRPGARLAFHGIPYPAEETVTFPPDATGLVNRDDFDGTLALARRLQPSARRILVISGASPLDSELERRAFRPEVVLAALNSIAPR